MSMHTITQARAKLSELVREAEDDDVVVINHSRPVAVLVGIHRHEAMLEEIEDLRDRLSVYERGSEPTIPAEKLMAELGL